MIKLERLILCFTTDRYGRFTAGNDLKKDIIDHMPRLNQLSYLRIDQ